MTESQTGFLSKESLIVWVSGGICRIYPQDEVATGLRISSAGAGHLDNLRLCRPRVAAAPVRQPDWEQRVDLIEYPQGPEFDS